MIGGLLAADAAVFGLWNTESAPSAILIVGFLLFAVNAYALSLGLLKLAGLYGLAPVGQRRRLARITTVVFSGLVALQSIGELSARDILVLLPFVALTYFYVSYQRGGKAARAPLS